MCSNFSQNQTLVSRDRIDYHRYIQIKESSLKVTGNIYSPHQVCVYVVQTTNFCKMVRTCAFFWLSSHLNTFKGNNSLCRINKYWFTDFRVHYVNISTPLPAPEPRPWTWSNWGWFKHSALEIRPEEPPVYLFHSWRLSSGKPVLHADVVSSS